MSNTENPTPFEAALALATYEKYISEGKTSAANAITIGRGTRRERVAEVLAVPERAEKFRAYSAKGATAAAECIAEASKRVAAKAASYRPATRRANKAAAANAAQREMALAEVAAEFGDPQANVDAVYDLEAASAEG